MQAIIFSTAEICDLFNISKSTLFRWEREEKITHVQRDPNSKLEQRIYTRESLREIVALLRERAIKKYEAAAKSDSPDIQQRLGHEAIELSALYNILGGKQEGMIAPSIQELGTLDRLGIRTVKVLLRVAALDLSLEEAPMIALIIRSLAAVINKARRNERLSFLYDENEA